MISFRLTVAPAGRELFYYLAAAILVLMILVGINRMSKVETSVSGNRMSALSMLLAIILTLWYFEIFSVVDIWIGLLIGSLLGLVLAGRVRMIEMPQMVGLLNGLGGGASMLAGILTLTGSGRLDTFEIVTAGLAIAVGGLTFSGSLVAAFKLHGIIPGKPVVLRGHRILTTVTLVLMLLTAVLFAVQPFRNNPGWPTLLLILLSAALSLLFGVLFSIRVGGADMPITISLLNSFSGVAGSIAGMAIGDALLVAVGGVVGASGLLLTQIMCHAMNRPLQDILFAYESFSSKGTAASPHPSAPPPDQPAVEPASTDPFITAVTWLKEADRVIIVPGYGMALSQAQPLVRQLDDWLDRQGIEVYYGIHPVAGRMPGHMNVLLAEVDVSYDKMLELDDANERLADIDVVLVIGANDVVNPAAGTAEGTPIYGMPILEVEQAGHIIMCNFDQKPGYAGVDNPLYTRTAEKVTLLFGDASETLTALLAGLNNQTR